MVASSSESSPLPAGAGCQTRGESGPPPAGHGLLHVQTAAGSGASTRTATAPSPPRPDSCHVLVLQVAHATSCDDDEGSVGSGGDASTTSSVREVAKRVAGESVARAALWHTQLQNSLRAQRIVACMLVLALFCSTAVPIAQSWYRHLVADESVHMMEKGAVATAFASVRPSFQAEHEVHEVLAYAMDSGWLRGPLDAERLEQIMAPFFVERRELVAVDFVHR